MKPTQESIAQRLINDSRPVHEWSGSVGRLTALLYEHDPGLSRQLEILLRGIESFAGNLDCVGTDDPTAPAIGAPAREVLSYLFRVSPENLHEFQRIITRADQLLGRARLLEATMADDRR
jgi:hypothetical protein